MMMTIADVVAYEVAYFRKKNRVTIGSPAKLAPSMKSAGERRTTNERRVQRGIMGGLAGSSRGTDKLYKHRSSALAVTDTASWRRRSHENLRCYI